MISCRLALTLVLISIASPALANDLFKCNNHLELGREVQLLIDNDNREIFELWSRGMTLAQVTSWSDDFIAYVVPVADPENPSLVTGVFSRIDMRLVTSTVSADETLWDDISVAQAARSNLLYQCEMD